MKREQAERAAKSQSDKFKDLAHEVEANEDEQNFTETLKRVAKARPISEALQPPLPLKPKT